MPNPNALVDTVGGLSPRVETLAAMLEQPPRFVTVNFQGGRSGLLDMTSPRSVVWASVLDSMHRSNAPAYVVIDPATNVITELLSPLTVEVGAITPTAPGDAVEVELIISQAAPLPPAHEPRFPATAEYSGDRPVAGDGGDRHGDARRPRDHRRPAAPKTGGAGGDRGAAGWPPR